MASAEFPYARPGADKKDYTQLRTDKGQVPPDLTGDNVWKFSATPEPNNFPVNAQQHEQFGIRGGFVADADLTKDTAWTVTTGRPDVSIAVLDSGIDWRELDLHNKVRLSRGELPKPNHGGPALLTGVNCGSYADEYDANADGVFNLIDYACDSRLQKDTPRGVMPATFDPQDVLIAFSDGTDADGNGFVDDIAGWDFMDDDNDAFDDVEYDHGTGEAQGSTAEVNDNRGDEGTCPNCFFVPTRVGDSFVADANRFAQAVIYGVDNGVYVIQEALGTLNNTRLAREAIDYAYNHGVVVIASAADEAAQHHNYVSSLPHTVVVNSVRNNEIEGAPGIPKSYLAFNGCTNFSSKITLAIPSTSCSSDATGVGSGMAGLVYSAALNGIAQGKLAPHPTCKLASGAPCPLSANEVRQLMASGAFAGQTQPDDVNFLAGQAAPEPSCASRAAGCTDPNGMLQTQVNANRPVVNPPDSRSYPARFGPDQFYGWGRVNTFRAVDRPARGYMPPEVEITSPDWFAQVDPTKPTATLSAQISARGGAYSCRVYVAPGSYPNNHRTTDTPAGDFKEVPSPVCNGTNRTAPIDGTVAALDLVDLKARFPADAGDFRGRETGHGAGQTSNGRPNSEPYGFTVRVVATAAVGSPIVAATGEDQRNLYLHRDQDMLDGFPKQLPGDGESSPVFADLDGDNRNELIFATADGRVNAMKPDGSQAAGWPVRGDSLPLHSGGRAFQSGEVSESASFGSFLASVAVADLDRDGSLEVIGADFEGKVYAWSADGDLLWKREANPAYSGKPLQPFANVRAGKTNRTQHGFIASPVAADLDRNDGGRLEVILAGMDRHVYAFQDNGGGVPGYPVLVVDSTKVESVDGTTHRVRFRSDAQADDEQGAIIDTPALGNVSGDTRPEIVVGTNEQYSHGGTEGGANIGGGNAISAQVLSRTGALVNANTRLYAIKPEGERDGNAASPDWAVTGWPVKMTLLMAGLLPVVGEGVTGAPALAPVECPSGGAGLKIGAFGNNGVGYVFNGDGSSCLGRSDTGHNAMDTDQGGGGDRPTFPAVGHPAFGNFAGGVSFLGPTAGLIRALDLLAPEYQMGGQDFISAWDPATGKFRSGFPARMNDLQFLTGPSVADIDGAAGEELLAGSAYLDLQAYNGSGQPVSDRWPKITSDWMVANPLIGSFGTLDTEAAARKTVVASTRSGYVFAYKTTAPPCTPASWPRFHHDMANSGDYTRDATNPGAPMGLKLFETGLGFKAPGDDLLCGKAARYELVSSDSPLDAATFGQGTPLPVKLTPGDPGADQAIELGGNLQRHLALRAVDEQGNVGPVRVVTTSNPEPGSPPGSTPTPPADTPTPGGGSGDGPAPAPAPGPVPVNPPPTGDTCRDRKPPLSSIRLPIKASSRKKSLSLSGRTADTGCRTAAERNALVTSISIAKREGRRCRFLDAGNRLSKARSCSNPIRLRTAGKYSLARLKLEWSYRAKVRLPRGTYLVRAYGADQSGNVEAKVTRRNSKTVRVR